MNILTELTRLVMPKQLGAAPLLAIGMGIMGVMSATAKQKAADENAKSEARAYGIRVAGIDFAADRTANALVNSLALVKENEVVSNVQIEQDQAKAESDAKVSAATAGVAGQSTDAVVNDTERTASEAQGAVTTAVRQQALQIQTDYVDNYLNAEISKGNPEFKTASESDRRNANILGFAQGFMGGL